MFWAMLSVPSPSADGEGTVSGWTLPLPEVAWRTQWWGSGSNPISLDGLGFSQNITAGPGGLECLRVPLFHPALFEG